jgi:hypothetical protein
MRDYTWLDNRKYLYGVLGSNDEKKFSGGVGNVSEAIIFDVTVIEGE